MSKIDKTYHKLLNDILENGFKYEDPNRKDIYRYQIPHYTIKHDFKDGFPAITTKKLYWKSIVGELLWFLRGDENIKYLVDNGINIWNKDAYNWYLDECLDRNLTRGLFSYDGWLDHLKSENFNRFGDLGRIYGAQWRNWKSFKEEDNGMLGVIKYAKHTDQIANLIKGLKENPMGTRHIVTAWNPAELDDMALPPCHWSFEILVEPISENICKSKTCNYNADCLEHCEHPKYQFTLKWHQRSVDSFLGLPFNIASYSLLAHIIGKITNMIPKGIIGDLSNVHIYEPHLDAVKEQLSRDVNKYGKCELDELSTRPYNELDNLDNWLKVTEINKINLKNYKSYPAIPAEMLAYNKKI